MDTERATQQSVVVDVTDADFEERVVDESKRRPVVVDLWAEWCGPCRTLSPIMERAAQDRAGRFLLAKLDVDTNPMTARAFGVQSIPMVIAFRDGQPVDGFIGAIPEGMVEEFLDRVLPSEADLTARGALEEERAGDVEDAEQGYRDALSAEPDNRAARLGLGRILADRGEADEARKILTPLVPDPDAERVLAGLRVAAWGAVEGPGTLASAERLAAQGKWRDALEGMLGALRDDPAAREAMLDVFAVLGDDDPLVTEYRRRLANVLF